MNSLAEFGSETLQAAFLRDEIPEAMVWLGNEGFETVGPELLDRYLWIDTKLDDERLDDLVDRGLLRRASAGHYELTDAGSEHGARVFAHNFAELEKVSRGPVLCACGCCDPPYPDDDDDLRRPGVAGATG